MRWRRLLNHRHFNVYGPLDVYAAALNAATENGIKAVAACCSELAKTWRVPVFLHIAARLNLALH